MVVDLLSMCNFGDFILSSQRREVFRKSLSTFQATMQSPSGTWDPRLRQFMEAALIYPIEDAIDNGRPFDIDMALNEIYSLKAYYKQVDKSKEADTLFRKLFFGIEAFRVFNNSTAHHQQGQGRGLPSSDVIDEQFQLHWKVHLDLAMRTIVHYIVWIHKEIRTRHSKVEPDARQTVVPNTNFPNRSSAQAREQIHVVSPAPAPTVETPTSQLPHFETTPVGSAAMLQPTDTRPRLNSAPRPIWPPLPEPATPTLNTEPAPLPSALSLVPGLTSLGAGPSPLAVLRELQDHVIQELRERTEMGRRARFWVMCSQGNCPTGCNMAHTAQEMKIIGICRAVSVPGWKATTCNKAASCTFGVRCDYIHPSDDIQLIEAIKQTASQLETCLVMDGTSMALVRFGDGAQVQVLAP
ncbi:Aste57867_16514 [Aphanomyces stellatus]|uniref:Aste57867_16514 protein n=1 Tax=Aphanomyces stellatus TaxID=120398 RepID=A0A485L5U2_9STRA|nr:hypothetical protein As57867_016457 [Aphanomyces stellatus]VFT93288.1 Aste57867_16514 [Aphanomyces stellatus]